MRTCFNAHCHANNDVDGAGPSGCVRVACGDIETINQCLLSNIDTRAALAELPNTSTNSDYTAALKVYLEWAGTVSVLHYGGNAFDFHKWLNERLNAAEQHIV